MFTRHRYLSQPDKHYRTLKKPCKLRPWLRRRRKRARCQPTPFLRSRPMSEIDDLPRSEFGFPGQLRDTLVAAIVAGEKTATTSTLVEYGIENEPLPVAGARYVVVD